MNTDKKLYTAIVVLGVIILALTLWESFRPGMPASPDTQSGVGAGEHCGGFINGAALCAPGLHCQLNISNPDAGGTCVADVSGAASYEDATYAIDGVPVTLARGVSQVPAAPGSASMNTVRIFGNAAVGDLDGNGEDDVAFLLTEDGGGSGTFYYIAVALKNESGYVGTNAVIIGDRIAPQTTSIKNGSVIVNYADRKKDEPMSVAPSVGITRTYHVENGTLNRVQN